jgi:NAD(P)-dependent dehydrogenase (short-subunit alcohol dehydrogenase family)
MILKNNESKTALVVGGSGGIGMAVIRRLKADGFNLRATYNKNKPEDSTDSAWYKLNVCDFGEMEKCLDEIGGVDVVVYAPTMQTAHHPISKLDWESMQAHFETQTKGFFHIVKALLPTMKEHPVNFVVILTEYCLGKPPAGLANYVGAKYGLMGFAKSMAIELAKYGSRVNMVSPGITRTNLISNLPAKLIEIAKQQNPLGRIAAPEDVSGVVSFLVSSDANYLNGVNIPVNGGNTLQ